MGAWVCAAAGIAAAASNGKTCMNFFTFTPRSIAFECNRMLYAKRGEGAGRGPAAPFAIYAVEQSDTTVPQNQKRTIQKCRKAPVPLFVLWLESGQRGIRSENYLRKGSQPAASSID